MGLELEGLPPTPHGKHLAEEPSYGRTTAIV